MNRSVINYQEYTSSAYWRQPDQLRGLIKNHPDLVAQSGALAAPGNLFTSCGLSLHSSESGLAILLSPLSGMSSVGLMPIEGSTAGLGAAGSIRWLDLQEGISASSVEWGDELLFLGCNKGRILVADAPLQSVYNGSGMFEPCGALCCSELELGAGEIIVPHSSHAVSTAVRSVRVNRGIDESKIIAVRGRSAFLWNLEGSATPVSEWAPHEDLDDTAPLVFARWAPNSDSVVLTGTYEGCVMLVDTRGPEGHNGLSFAVRKGFACTSADFDPILPTVFAASSSDGTFSLFDVRHTSQPILSIPSLQGNISSLTWLKLNSDLLVTGGGDGTVAIWNVRSPPTYCVGRVQYKYSVSDLVSTQTFLDQRAFGVSIGGEITLTGLTSDAMMQLAPNPIHGTVGTRNSEEKVGDNRGETNEEEQLREKETAATGYLYTRRLRSAFSLLAECAAERLQNDETEAALKLVGLMDVNRVFSPDYSTLIQSKAANPQSALTLNTIRQAFNTQLLRSATYLSTTVKLDHIKDLQKPDSLDIRKLEALRLNIILSQVLATQDPDKVAIGVEKALELLSAHPESFELINNDIVCGIVALLLKKNFQAGEKFVKFLLSKLNLLISSSPTSLLLLKHVMRTVQEPLIISDGSKLSKRFEERFFRNLGAAQDAILTQLAVTKLGIENYKEVISTINSYQSRCIQQNLPGIHRWLGIKPILLFLHCLTADSNYVSFFWTSVQCIQAYGQFNGVRQIENVLFSVVDRINGAAEKIADQLDRLADTERLTVPVLRQIDNALRTAHGFLNVLVRVQLECENVAIDSNLDQIPPLMDTILNVLSDATENVLEMWGSVVDLLIDVGQPEMVKKYCFVSIRDFSFDMEDLMEVSSKSENDERLNAILDVCDDFLESIA